MLRGKQSQCIYIGIGIDSIDYVTGIGNGITCAYSDNTFCCEPSVLPLFCGHLEDEPMAFFIF